MELLQPFTLVAGKWFLIYICLVGILSAAECILSKRPKPAFLNKRKGLVAVGALCATFVLFTWSHASGNSGTHIQYVKSKTGSIFNFDDCPHNDIVCKNGGSCVDGDNSWTCACKPGFTGSLCEIDVDECMSSPCLHGGWCTDGPNSYTCSCTNSFTGPNCEETVAKYEGCYADDIKDRDLSENLKLARGSMTNAMCWENCKGFKYAATQFHNECWCSNTFGKHGKTDEGDCNLLCDGNKEEICGGKLFNSVFYIAKNKHR